MSRFKLFTLEKLLPEGATLMLDMEQGILTLLTENRIIEQQILSPSEMYVAEALLANFPDYCPYEVVLAAMTGNSIDQCRKRVLWGLNEDNIDVVMRPVRNLLARCRMKLVPFGVQIKSLQNTGYILVASKRLLTTPPRMRTEHKEEVYS